MSLSFFVLLLTLAVILANGWTDAPNAIATAVSTGALTFEKAVFLAAACNFAGVFVMCTLCPTVAETVYSMVRFPETGAALSALCASLCAIVIWATAAWYFGIPTSESHALVSALTGAATALPGGFSNVSGGAWVKILVGLFLSVGLGFVLGKRFARPICAVRWGDRAFRRLQILGAAAMAFLHGAQDGQKFIGVLLLGETLALGRRPAASFSIPLGLMALCALVMALGTLMGGRRIVEKIGSELVPLSSRLGFAADLAGAATLLASSLIGVPVSTSHVRTCSILGVGGGDGLRVNRRAAGGIVSVWMLTFPVCFFLGKFLTQTFFCKFCEFFFHF